MSKTTYIKMIDVWLLFGLVLPFLGFLLSIFEELVAQLQEDADVGRMKVEPQLFSYSILMIICHQGVAFVSFNVSGKAGKT